MWQVCLSVCQKKASRNKAWMCFEKLTDRFHVRENVTKLEGKRKETYTLWS